MVENFRTALEAWIKSLFTLSLFTLRFIYLLSKSHREFEFFIIAREISESDFFSIFYKRKKGIITLWSGKWSYWIKSNRDYIYLLAIALKVFLSSIFFFSSLELLVVSDSYHLIQARLYFKQYERIKEWNTSIFRSRCF